MKLALALAAVVVGALLASEVVMGPTAGDRLGLLAIFTGVAVITAAAGKGLAHLTGRIRSLRHVVLLITLATVGVAAAAIGSAAGFMFISTHDLRLVLIALGFGVASGTVVAGAVADPLQRDLHRLGEAADRVAAGDLTVRSGIDRRDELGTVAATFDDMVAALADAEEQRRLDAEARRRFLAAISHDLRTPLASMRSAIEALEDDVVDEPRRYYGAMARDVDTLSALVDDLFLLARIESGGLRISREQVDLAEVIDGVTTSAVPLAAKRGVDLGVDLQAGTVTSVDPQAIGRVVRNLVDNAVRHSPEGTKVTVRLQRTDNGATVRVEDEGPGFDPSFLPLAFDSFTRSDEARTRDAGGAGLGLAIARGLVEAHGGSIRAEPGPGGKVAFTLPLR